MLCLLITVLFKSGARHDYNMADSYEWHDGIIPSNNVRDIFLWQPTVVHNKWLILIRNGNEIKCLDGTRIQDVLYGTENASN